LGATRHEGSGREELARPKTAGDGWAGTVQEEKKEEKEEKEREAEREKERERDEGGPMDVKPIYLKGLFSVATTSTRPAHVIKADVKRVLDRMQVQYREIRGGFECIHMPSIDLTSIVNAENTAGAEGVPRRSVVRKGSRISFGKKGPPPKEGEKEIEEKEKDKDKERVPTSRSSLSFAGLKGQAQPDKETGRTTPVPASSTPAPGSPTSPGKTKFLPPIPRDFGNHGEKGTGVTPEVAEDVFENGTTNELCVRFEISIVKVPLLPLHGIQFRRVGGDGWQYQMLARRVLTELKL